MTDRIDFLSAIEEGEFAVAQANAMLGPNGELVDELVDDTVADQQMKIRWCHIDSARTKFLSIAWMLDRNSRCPHQNRGQAALPAWRDVKRNKIRNRNAGRDVPKEG